MFHQFISQVFLGLRGDRNEATTATGVKRLDCVPQWLDIIAVAG